jgi:hypothetical protein
MAAAPEATPVTDRKVTILLIDDDRQGIRRAFKALASRFR